MSSPENQSEAAANLLTTTDTVEAKADAVEANTESNVVVDTKQTVEDDKSQQSKESDDAENSESDAKTEKPKAPEKYEFSFEEGKELNDSVVAEFSDVAKELNLSQDDAQKVLDRMSVKIADNQQDAINKIRSDWETQSKADKEFGGDKLDENLAFAKKALDDLGTDELRNLLNSSGLGNNPEVIRFMIKAGKSISEDGFVGSKRSESSSKAAKDFNDHAKTLYASE